MTLENLSINVAYCINILKILMIFVVNLKKRGLTIYSSHINS